MNINHIINNIKTYFEEFNIPYCILKNNNLLYKSKNYNLINKNYLKTNIYNYKNKYFKKIYKNYSFNNENYIIEYFFEITDFIKQIKILEEENKKLKKDPITGLYTRSEIEIFLTKLNTNATIVICDIDNFKKVNDTHGHLKGDEVLKELGNIIKEETKSNKNKTFAGRYGGEEFLIIFNHNNINFIINKINTINYRFNKSNIVSGLSISAGISHFNNNNHIKKIIEEADIALYEAKKTGKNKIVIYTKNLSNKK